MQYAPVPSWENTELQKLSAEGQLSGVPPQVLSAIDLAESSGQGGGVNGSGYGGFFGLGASTQYPTGRTSSAMLAGTDPNSFDQQAIIAAGEFASLLESHNMDPLAAERAYQGGGSEGTSIFQTYGIGGTPIDASVNPNSAATLTGNSNGNTDSTVWGHVGPFQVSTPYGFLSRAVLMLVGVFLLYLGAKQLTSDNGAVDTVTVGTRNAAATMKQNATKATEVGTAAAAA